jgi:hypothetical protein
MSLAAHDAGAAGGVPDRLCLWPVEGGRFGIDASFQGTTGYTRVEAHEHALRKAGVPYKLRQELDGSWTLRLGPVPAAEVGVAVDAFVGAGR